MGQAVGGQTVGEAIWGTCGRAGGGALLEQAVWGGGR